MFSFTDVEVSGYLKCVINCENSRCMVGVSSLNTISSFVNQTRNFLTFVTLCSSCLLRVCYV